MKNIGIIYMHQGDYGEALHYYDQGIAAFKKAQDKKGIADILKSIAIVQQYQGNLVMAMENSLAALRIFEELEDLKGVASS